MALRHEGERSQTFALPRSARAAWRTSRLPGLVHYASAARRRARSRIPFRATRSRLPILSGGARSSALPRHPQLHSSTHSPRRDETSSRASCTMAPKAQHSARSARQSVSSCVCALRPPRPLVCLAPLSPARTRPGHPRSEGPHWLELRILVSFTRQIRPTPPRPTRFRETPKASEEGHAALRLPYHLFG